MNQMNETRAYAEDYGPGYSDKEVDAIQKARRAEMEATKQPTSPVSRNITNIDEHLRMLQTTLGVLSDRLSPLMAPEEDHPEPNNIRDKSLGSSMMYYGLDGIDTRIMDATYAINQLLLRLEV